MNKIHKLGRTRSNPFGMPLLAILIFLGTCQSLWAQTPFVAKVANSYAFTSASGVYVPITGTIVVPGSTVPNADDNFYTTTTTPAIPAIPFPFIFNGVSYTSCTLSANGWIGFGNVSTALTADILSPISNNLPNGGIIAAFAKNLCSRTAAPLSELRTDVVGVTPNREYVIQFSNWGLALGITPTAPITIRDQDIYNFQIRLQENGSKIVVVYGNMVLNNTTRPVRTGTQVLLAPANNAALARIAAANTQVGLRGATNTDFNNRATSWAASTSGATNAAVLVSSGALPATLATDATTLVPAFNAQPAVNLSAPASGLTYSWSPVLCTTLPATSAVMSSLIPVSGRSLACAGASFTLSTTGTAAVGTTPGTVAVTGNTFQWEYANSTTSGLFQIVPASNLTSTSSNCIVTQTEPTTYRCIIKCSAAVPAPLTITTSSLAVDMKPVIDCYCATTPPVVVAGVGCITNVTLGTGVGSINNTTTCATSPLYTPANTGVTLFPSSITTSLAQGSSNTITVTTAPATASVGVWVDFNANGTYDALGEYFPVVAGTATIVTPLTATIGVTKMRVRSRIGALTAGDACTSFTTAGSSGEIEDYYININPSGCSPVVIASNVGSLNFTKDVAITSITLTASGGSGAPYTYVLTGTTPAGVTFNPVTGVISGTPLTVESGTFTITATSSVLGGCKGSVVYNFNVNNSCRAVVVSCATASPTGVISFTVSKAASTAFSATDGTPTLPETVTDYVYDITSGTLPTGVTLSIAKGELSGVPNALQSGTFTIRATSVMGNCSGSATYTYNVTCPPMVLSPVGPLSFVYGKDAGALSLAASGGASSIFGTASGAFPLGVTLTNVATPTSAAGSLIGTPALTIKPFPVGVAGTTGTVTVTVNTTPVPAAAPVVCTATTTVYDWTIVCPKIELSPNAGAVIFTKDLAIQPIEVEADVEANGKAAAEDAAAVEYTYSVTGLPAGLTSSLTAFASGSLSTCTGAISGGIGTGCLTNAVTSKITISGIPTTAGSGFFEVTAISKFSDCPYTRKYQYTIIGNPATSLDALSSQVKVSPNPSKGEFNIDFNGIALGKATIHVYDAQGKQVYTSNVNNNQMTISLENLSSGIYLMEVNSTKGRILKRLAKQ